MALTTGTLINMTNTSDSVANGEDMSSYSSYYDYEMPVTVETWLIPLIFGAICVVGIVGNALVIYVIIKNKQMRTVTNYYILNLAVSDVAFLTCAVPFTATSHVSEWVFGEFMCKFSFYAIQVTVQATCFTLTVMSVDRYYAISHPLKSLKTRTPKVAISVIAATWLCSCLMAIPVPVFREVLYLYWYGIQPFCIDKFPTFGWYYGWYVYTFIAVYALPVLVISICYARMLCRLWSQVTPGEESAQHKQSIKQKKKITRMVFMVTLMFFICWMPIHIQSIWARVDFDGYNAHENIYYFHVFSNCLSYANSCVNPFIYAFMGEHFRKCFRKVFPKCFKSRSATIATIDQRQGMDGSNLGSMSISTQKQVNNHTLETLSRA